MYINDKLISFYHKIRDLIDLTSINCVKSIFELKVLLK
jgi:hypothetical protein